ncbi:MAG: biopolymer transporter ExbD [Thermomonas sp.]|uniref:ExbD/TolR family protein n=1 Tax=Thermomonas sp. TaxID=1971895 RepID=UPI002605DFAB|nr:biopolymer transporter ExbD [Thermomonas sp.]MCC7097385.1 biopolymer transporter ExbD [Thermomonas sp.]
MAFSSGSSAGTMADINVTPLVDVLLVLLIIFMVTMPIQSIPVDVDLPQKTDNPVEPPPNPPEPIKLRIDGAGQVFWNNSPVQLTELEPKMREESQRDPLNQPELQIETNESAQYGILAKVLVAAKNARLVKIGFVQ